MGFLWGRPGSVLITTAGGGGGGGGREGAAVEEADGVVVVVVVVGAGGVSGFSVLTSAFASAFMGTTATVSSRERNIRDILYC